MSAKVNMEAPSKEQDSTPLDPSSSSPSDGLANKARPQPHTTTAFLLQGELRSEGSRVPHGFKKTILELEHASVTTVPTGVYTCIKNCPLRLIQAAMASVKFLATRVK